MDQGGAVVNHTDACKLAILAIIECGGRAWPRTVGLFRDVRTGKPRSIGTTGEADVQGIIPGGWAIAAEVKTGKACRSSEQIQWGEMWTKLGGVYVVARFAPGYDGQEIIRDAIRERIGDPAIRQTQRGHERPK